MPGGIMNSISQHWANLTPQQQRAITTAAIGAGAGGLAGLAFGKKKKRLGSALLGGLLGAAGGGTYGWMTDRTTPLQRFTNVTNSAAPTVASVAHAAAPGAGPAAAAVGEIFRRMPEMLANRTGNATMAGIPAAAMSPPIGAGPLGPLMSLPMAAGLSAMGQSLGAAPPTPGPGVTFSGPGPGLLSRSIAANAATGIGGAVGAGGSVALNRMVMPRLINRGWVAPRRLAAGRIGLLGAGLGAGFDLWRNSRGD